MAGRVLVQQDVVEHETGAADRRGTVDQRDLPESDGAIVGREIRTDGISVGIGAHFDDPPALEPQSQPVDRHAADQLKRACGEDGAVGSSVVGRREHFLGRHVHDHLSTPVGSETTGEPLRTAHQADREICTAAVKPQRPELITFEHGGALAQPPDVSSPCLLGIVRVQTEDRRQDIP